MGRDPAGDRPDFRAARHRRRATPHRNRARFVAAPVPVVLHVIAAIPYTILGAFQFSAALRRRRREWHRAAGRILVVLGLVVALTGLWMAQFYAWPEGDGELLYLLRVVFGSAMAISIVCAVGAIKRRDFVSHGAWMIRGYAIGLGAGTQVLTHVPWFILVGQPGEVTRAVLMGAGWVINLVVAEWIIRRGPASLAPRQRSRDFECPTVLDCTASIRRVSS